MSVFSTPFCNYVSVEKALLPKNLYFTKIVHDIEVISAELNKTINITLYNPQFSHILIDSIIFDVGSMNTDTLDECYLELIIEEDPPQIPYLYRGENLAIKTYKLPMNLIRMLSLEKHTITGNKSRIFINKDFFLFDTTCHGAILFTGENKITIKLTNESLDKLPTKTNIKFDLVIKKISKKTCSRISRDEIITIPKILKRNEIVTTNVFTQEPIYENNFIGMTGYFLYTETLLKSIKYRFSSTSNWHNNPLPQDNLFKQWFLTRKHRKALYEVLEDILPNEMIYLIEQYCNPQYLYWFPFAVYKEWNDPEISNINGNLRIECNFDNRKSCKCKLHVYKHYNTKDNPYVDIDENA